MKQVRLEFNQSNLLGTYATHITVQHTDREFVISYYQANPPLVLGTAEEKAQQIEQIDSVEATCVARIIVHPDRMFEFIRILQENFDNYSQSIAEDLEDG